MSSLDFPFSISVQNSPLALLYTAIAIVVVIFIIWAVIKKLRSDEKLKYEFITIIAHKFRTPLTHVKWSTDELVKSEQDPYRKQSLTDIQGSNEKLIKLTNTLLEITDSANKTASTYNMERVSLCDFIRESSSAFKDMFHEKNIFFAVECPPEQLFVKIDRQRMEFVIQTLLENALNYSPTGKNVEVKIYRNG